ncbi:hypothetical protein I8G32_01425 [Rhodopseudomonas palustris]|uniref:Pyridoxamine 5'-phosphate oxidase family protein n=2 Tax=Rhodopseudomonas palustris (strain ATCC BAA-98 / CGA009) TaxID=258594 RepID=Q6N9Z3_RHOPA|nr:flavin-nucleotide-binding protein [Rhodopseudomonas palustris]PPQ43802.1 pyridoxamine 5'-phosphate oxidase family protein [Rhodopseudomonas palustris]QQM02890.1 hypothetical protein I8G32_01425 [Rhodopseudomonas palustris]CAE26836.1 conserved hypothetical protein [Rhodopseudomonas palustris CGA009]
MLFAHSVARYRSKWSRHLSQNGSEPLARNPIKRDISQWNWSSAEMTTADTNKPAEPPTERTRLKRYHWLAKYDQETINAIIDAGIVCQIGYVIDSQPYVTPTNHWRIDDYVYWHGSSASRMLKEQQRGIPVCFTVTHLDGIVFSRAAFNHNINFRSVMAFGHGELCDEELKREALQVFVDRLAPGLWDYARKPTDQEWKASKVIRMKLDEVSAKVSDGLPDEEPEDLASNLWAGSIGLQLVQAPPVPDPKLRPGIDMPDFVKNFKYSR